MNRYPFILFALPALLAWLGGQTVTAAAYAGAPNSPVQVPVVDDSDDVNLVIENGIIGIAKVHAIFKVLNGSGRFDLMIVAENTGFAGLTVAMKDLDRPVLAELPGTDLVLWLKAHYGGRYLYGHVQGTGQRVYVLPARSVHKG